MKIKDIVAFAQEHPYYMDYDMCIDAYIKLSAHKPPIKVNRNIKDFTTVDICSDGTGTLHFSLSDENMKRRFNILSLLFNTEGKDERSKKN